MKTFRKFTYFLLLPFIIGCEPEALPTAKEMEISRNFDLVSDTGNQQDIPDDKKGS